MSTLEAYLKAAFVLVVIITLYLLFTHDDR